jgi:hypothetical protein
MSKVLIAIIVVVAILTIGVFFATKSGTTNGCAGEDVPCPDTWTNTASPATKKCDPASLTWVDGGVGGPSKCSVACAPGYFPCWDDDKKQGDCRVGTTKDVACFTKCTAASCGPNGTCIDTLGTCLCNPGFTGVNCEKAITETCVAKPFQYCNNGLCRRDTGACVCNPGWYGDLCDDPGKCDLNVCRAVDKNAYCSDPKGLNPGDCVCSPGHGPVNGKTACSTCLSGYGPAVGTNPLTPYEDTRVAACSQQLDYHDAKSGAPTLFAVRGGDLDYDKDYWCFDGSHSEDFYTERCQAAFGPSSTSNKYTCNNYQDLPADKSCRGFAMGRPLCYVPAYYTSAGVDPNASAYTLCNTGGGDRGGRPSTLLPPGFLPAQ